MSDSGDRRWCQSCKKTIEHPSETGWECECGVVVCSETDCYEEYFKTVAGGEGVRCRSCGHVT